MSTTIRYAGADQDVVLVDHGDGRQESARAESVEGQRFIAAYGPVAPYVPPPPPTQEQLEALCLTALNGGSGGIDLLRLLKAKAISDEAYRLGKSPAQLTAQELQAMRQRIANVFKAL